MNILFVGGSNLVISKGIADQLIAALKAAGIDIESVTNLAVGGTGSLFGVENIEALPPTLKFDLIILEYGINDLGTYTRAKDLWEVGYGLLLTDLRRRYSEASLFSVLLGRRDERFWRTQNKLHADIARITSEAKGHCIHVDAHLKAMAPSNEQFMSLYRDDSHFHQPFVTDHIAQICCASILAKWCGDLIETDPDAGLNSKIGASKYKLTMAHAEGEVAIFENSRFGRVATPLRVGKEVLIPIQGIPVGLSFVSTPDAGPIRITFNGVVKFIYSLHREVKSGKFGFIIKHVPLEGLWTPDADCSGVNEVRIACMPPEEPEESDPRLQKVYGMVKPSSTEPVVNLIALTGLTAAAQPSQEQVTQLAS